MLILIGRGSTLGLLEFRLVRGLGAGQVNLIHLLQEHLLARFLICQFEREACLFHVKYCLRLCRLLA